MIPVVGAGFVVAGSVWFVVVIVTPGLQLVQAGLSGVVIGIGLSMLGLLQVFE